MGNGQSQAASGSTGSSAGAGSFVLPPAHATIVERLGLTLDKLLNGRDMVSLADVLTGGCKETTLFLASALRRELTDIAVINPDAPTQLTSLLFAPSDVLARRAAADPTHAKLCEQLAAFLVRVVLIVTALTLSLQTSRLQQLGAVFGGPSGASSNASSGRNGGMPNAAALAARRGLPDTVITAVRDRVVPLSDRARMALTRARALFHAQPDGTLQLGSTRYKLDPATSLVYRWSETDGRLRVLYMQARTATTAAGATAPPAPTTTAPVWSATPPSPTAYVNASPYHGTSSPVRQVYAVPSTTTPLTASAPPASSAVRYYAAGGADADDSPAEAGPVDPFLVLEFIDVTSPNCVEALCPVMEPVTVDTATGYVLGPGGSRRLLAEVLKQRFSVSSLKPVAVPTEFFDAERRAIAEEARVATLSTSGKRAASGASGTGDDDATDTDVAEGERAAATSPAAAAVEARAAAWLLELRNLYDTGMRGDNGPSPAAYRALLLASRLMANGEVTSRVCGDAWAGLPVRDVPAFRALAALYLAPLTGDRIDGGSASIDAARHADFLLKNSHRGFVKGTSRGNNGNGATGATGATRGIGGLRFAALPARCKAATTAEMPVMDPKVADVLRAAHIRLRAAYDAHFTAALRLVAQMGYLEAARDPLETGLRVRFAPTLFKHPEGAFGKIVDIAAQTRELLVQHYATVEAEYRTAMEVLDTPAAAAAVLNGEDVAPPVGGGQRRRRKRSTRRNLHGGKRASMSSSRRGLKQHGTRRRKH